MFVSQFHVQNSETGLISMLQCTSTFSSETCDERGKKSCRRKNRISWLLLLNFSEQKYQFVFVGQYINIATKAKASHGRAYLGFYLISHEDSLTEIGLHHILLPIESITI